MPEPIVSLDIQLWRLAELGIELAPGRDRGDLLKLQSLDQFEADPYSLLLCALGSDGEGVVEGPLSNSVRHLDAECISTSEDYVLFMKHVADLTRDVVAITACEAQIVDSLGEVHLAFNLDGHRFQRSLTHEGDWLADEAIEFMGTAIAAAAGGQHLLLGIGSMGGQDFLLARGSHQEVEELNRLTARMWRWSFAESTT